MPSCGRWRSAVSAWSPVIILTRMPAARRPGCTAAHGLAGAGRAWPARPSKTRPALQPFVQRLAMMAARARPARAGRRAAKSRAADSMASGISANFGSPSPSSMLRQAGSMLFQRALDVDHRRSSSRLVQVAMVLAGRVEGNSSRRGKAWRNVVSSSPALRATTSRAASVGSPVICHCRCSARARRRCTARRPAGFRSRSYVSGRAGGGIPCGQASRGGRSGSRLRA
jgi:hypothetical protein